MKPSATAERIASSFVFLVIALMVSGCRISPRYVRPQVPLAPEYKELSGRDESVLWQETAAQGAAKRGNWWQIYDDPELNKLEDEATSSNQQIAAAAANFLAARAVVREARPQYFPILTTSLGIASERPSAGEFGGLTTASAAGSGLTVKSFTNYSLSLDASWEPDFWGRIRDVVRSDVFAAQASAADLENVRLSIQGELAADYYELRAQDSLKELFDSTLVAYQDALDLTRTQYHAGLTYDEAVAEAETQLKIAQAQDTNLDILRAQYEHAIAVLIGQPASSFSLPRGALRRTPPPVPTGVPSDLLERRPDIAEAERSVAQVNAQIGWARTAYFPQILLAASGGFGNSSAAAWFTWPSRFWSVGPSLAETIFDAGLRRATVQQYRAIYMQTVANYRQTVLTAFQQVEDNLASLRILSLDIEQQDAAVEAAARTLREAQVRYRTGLDPYLNVLTAQTALLTSQQTAVNYREQQIVASVQLVKALGGGWDSAQIPSAKQVRSRPSGN